VKARAAAAALALALALGSAAPAAAAAPEFPDARTRMWQTGMLREDRLQHASLAMTAGLSIGLLTRSPSAGFGGVLALGLLKEFRDARSDRFDWLDLTADVIGAGAGAALTNALAR
jgi:uncharacterized protein YfiM (DUF2279 family)